MFSTLVSVCGHTLYVPDIPTAGTVLDLGANRGGFSLAIAERYGCLCHAIEAAPDLFAKLPAHARINSYHYAIAAATGMREFRVSSNHESSSLTRVVGATEIARVEVPAIDLATFVDKHRIGRIDLMKVDIEGAEIEVLNGTPDGLLRQIRQISVEFHDFNRLVRKSDVKVVCRRMSGLGFFVARFSLRSYFDVLFLNTALSESTGAARAWLHLAPYGVKVADFVGYKRILD